MIDSRVRTMLPIAGALTLIILLAHGCDDDRERSRDRGSDIGGPLSPRETSGADSHSSQRRFPGCQLGQVSGYLSVSLAGSGADGSVETLVSCDPVALAPDAAGMTFIDEGGLRQIRISLPRGDSVPLGQSLQLRDVAYQDEERVWDVEDSPCEAQYVTFEPRELRYEGDVYLLGASMSGAVECQLADRDGLLMEMKGAFVVDSCWAENYPELRSPCANEHASDES